MPTEREEGLGVRDDDFKHDVWTVRILGIITLLAVLGAITVAVFARHHPGHSRPQVAVVVEDPIVKAEKDRVQEVLKDLHEAELPLVKPEAPREEEAPDVSTVPVPDEPEVLKPSVDQGSASDPVVQPDLTDRHIDKPAPAVGSHVRRHHHHWTRHHHRACGDGEGAASHFACAAARGAGYIE